MSEIIDIVNAQGRLLGLRKRKNRAHRDGDWHRTAHVWVYNDRGEILFQQRSPTKDIFAGRWDITGGHLTAGEEYDEAVLRELEEELGVQVTIHDLEPFGIQQVVEVDERNGIVNREFQKIYLLRSNRPASSFRLQTDEVTAVRFFRLDELRALLCDEQQRQMFCPTYEYYLRVVDAVEVRVKGETKSSEAY